MKTKKLTLDQTVTYEIKIPGIIDREILNWGENITLKIDDKDKSQPISILRILVDQAALHGFLQYLYAYGLPLLSIICVDWREGTLYKITQNIKK